MKKFIFILMILFVLFILSGCINEIPIGEIHANSEEYMNKEILTSGTINSTTQIFGLVGFKIQDEEKRNSIFVILPEGSSLPQIGDFVKVRGILQRGLSTYHINASEVYQE